MDLKEKTFALVTTDRVAYGWDTRKLNYAGTYRCLMLEVVQKLVKEGVKWVVKEAKAMIAKQAEKP